MNGRALRASINHTEVGSLQEVGGLWSFQYAAPWLSNPKGFALSPHIPLSAEPLLDGATQRPVQWYFDNLLPEEGQRMLLAGDARLDAADAYAQGAADPRCHQTHVTGGCPTQIGHAGEPNTRLLERQHDAVAPKTSTAPGLPPQQ